MYKRLKISWSVVVALTAVMMIVPLAYAVFVTIDTDNDAVDTTAWNTTTPSPYLSDGDNNVTIDDDMEISAAYVGTNGSASSDYLYFRVDTIAGPSAPAADERLNAVIDCNNDGDLTDVDTPTGHNDLFVSYTPSTDVVDIWITGTITDVGDGAAVDGERPSGANNSNEWRVLKSALTANGCTNAVTGALQFAFSTSLNDSQEDAISAGASWNSPTAVNLQDLGIMTNNTAVWIFFGLALVVGLGAGIFWHRRKA